MTGGASYTVSLPKDWVKEQGLKVGDVVAIIPGSDSSLTISPKDRIPSGQEGSVEVTLTPSRDQDREETLRNFVAQYLAGYDVIKIVFPASARPEVRTYLKEAARR
ncbi:MAG TPA: AbrB/MazE/SpoVT family DNA-binding domain-containing protein, partial [Candidatus Bathyarchaeia archaeon]